MLTTHQTGLVKATVPVLEEHAPAITKHFYARMFAHNPEVKAYFNFSHQRDGRQALALANAVIAYAKHINDLGQLSDAVKQIVQKHCSLGVQPEHYAVVGHHLIASIGEVLGDAATPDIVDAWTEAYQQLADILIGAERETYQRHADRSGGWQGKRRFLVKRIVQEATNIRSFILTPADQSEAVINFLPGQYVGVVLTINGQETRRNYSLSDAPGKKSLRISVQREEQGMASNYLHNHIKEGDSLELYAPCGEFILAPSQRPLVFLAGGIGITPLMSMSKTAVSQGRKNVRFIYATYNTGTHAFTQELAEMKASPDVSLHVAYSHPSDGDVADSYGFLTETKLSTLLPDAAQSDIYLLGSPPFMKVMRRYLLNLGVSSERIKYEFFGPSESLDEAAVSSQRVPVSRGVSVVV